MKKRSLYSDDELHLARRMAEGSPKVAADFLTSLGRGKVSRQLVTYWFATLGDVIPDAQVPEVVPAPPLPEDPHVEKLHKRIRNLELNLNQLRKVNRNLMDGSTFEEALIREVMVRVGCINVLRIPSIHQPANPTRNCSAELLLSDWQIGKLSPDYNSDVALRRIKVLTKSVLFQLQQKIDAGYHIDKVVIVLLGDIIESDKKHPNSGRATDCGTAEQIAFAITALFSDVIIPLAGLGCPVEVVCVTGNHDHDGHGITPFYAGREHLSYPLFKALELLTQQKAELTNVKFTIPQGSFATVDFYGQIALYEHGCGVQVNESSMRTHKFRRSEQLRQYITYFRMGDKHSVCTFNSGQYVVNGAFFSTDSMGAEYSSMAGYCSVAAQWLGFHVPRNNNLMTLYDSFTIQLGHVNV